MPRQFHKIVSKEDSNKQINLESMGYEQALEEALDKLGWVMQSEWNEPYNSMFQDEHMMSLNSQKSS
jgi:hypothetical protein